MKKKSVLISFFILILLIGLGIMFYPVFSNWYETNHHGEVIRAYEDDVNKLTNDEENRALQEAKEYNESLHKLVLTEDPFTSDFEMQNSKYDEILNIGNDGVMSYIKIPAIDVYLPIYHGTDSNVLSKGVGHLKNTSLPVGGLSTHCVISAHSGDASAKLFTNLEKLKIGDMFYLYTLNETLAYQVDQIEVVLPYETDSFRIQEGYDYVTLVTCTPYGINTHRLLVRGVRVPIDESETQAASNSDLKAPFDYSAYIILLLIAIAFILIFLPLLFIKRKRKKKKESNEKTE